MQSLMKLKEQELLNYVLEERVVSLLMKYMHYMSVAQVVEKLVMGGSHLEERLFLWK